MCVFVSTPNNCLPLVQEDRLSDVKYLDNWMVSFKQGSKGKILDLKTMKVVTVLQGVIPSYCSDMLLVNGGKGKLSSLLL